MDDQSLKEFNGQKTYVSDRTKIGIPENGNVIVSAGLEAEFNLLQALGGFKQVAEDYNLPLFLQNKKLVDEWACYSFATEIAGCGLEGRTEPSMRAEVPLQRGVMGDYFQNAFTMASDLKAKVKAKDLKLISAGTLPCTTGFLSRYLDTWICDNDRYRKMVNRQNKDDYTEAFYPIDVKHIHSQPQKKLVPMSSALYALASQHSINIGFSRQMTGFGANMMLALMPLAPIFSNSRVMFDGIGANCWNRLQYAIDGMGSKQKLFKFSVDGYYKNLDHLSLEEWMEHCLGRVLLVPPDEGGLKEAKGTLWPTLRARVGQSWTLGPRMVWGFNSQGGMMIWVENNAIDAQPTLTEGLALDLLITGTIAYWYYKGVTDVSQIMDASQIEATCRRISEHGPYSEEATITWHGKVYQARKWVLDHLIPNALDGIRKDDLCNPELAEKLFQVLSDALTYECTGSDWVLKEALKLRDSGVDEKLAVTKIMISLSDIQTNLEETLESPRGLYGVLQEMGL